MDLIRAVAKSIFADFPESEARRMAFSDYSFTDFEDTLKECLCHSVTEFSRSELSHVFEIAKFKWIGTSSKKTDSKSFNTSGLYDILRSVGDLCLDLSGKFPRVMFRNLLRWHELTYFISEEIVITASLADYDRRMRRVLEEREFTWPDILDHDNNIINEVLDRGISDIHAHLNASTDIFLFNWLSMMNSRKSLTEMAKRLNDDYFLGKSRLAMDRDIINPVGDTKRSFYNLGLAAALCRAFLFAYMEGHTSMAVEIFKELAEFVHDDPLTMSQTAHKIYDYINTLRLDAMKSVTGRVIDYAITQCDNDDPDSVYFIATGERKLMYRAFRRIMADPESQQDFSNILYLYLLLKNKLRGEFIQTNKLVGFENFQMYQERKGLFFTDPFWSELNFSYGVLSSLGLSDENCLEGRITPGALRSLFKAKVYNPYSHHTVPKWVGRVDSPDVVSDNFSVVVHFIKKPVFKGTISRFQQLKCFRKSLWSDMALIVNYAKGSKDNHRIRGIDVAGSELNCRPEIFAPMFRWAKGKGLGNNMTYHAGEDFFDLVDGLRTIYEVVMFMNFDSGCRIGHALALGKDACKYYGDRHGIIVAPAQIILDNLVWMKYFAEENGIILEKETLYFIDRITYDLFDMIGYDVSCTLDYWRSILLRGNDVDVVLMEDTSMYNPRVLTARPDFLQNNNIRINIRSEKLYRMYEMDAEVFRKGYESYEVKVTKSYVSDVEKLQFAIANMLRDKGIVIEANPSSNRLIGNFGRYDALPLFKLFPIDEDNEKRMRVCINTDDRGVFYTSLRNEYSLVAASLMKMKNRETDEPLYPITRIAEYIGHMVQNGNNAMFRPL